MTNDNLAIILPLVAIAVIAIIAIVIYVLFFQKKTPTVTHYDNNIGTTDTPFLKQVEEKGGSMGKDLVGTCQSTNVNVLQRQAGIDSAAIAGSVEEERVDGSGVTTAEDEDLESRLEAIICEELGIFNELMSWEEKNNISRDQSQIILYYIMCRLYKPQENPKIREMQVSDKTRQEFIDDLDISKIRTDYKNKYSTNIQDEPEKNKMLRLMTVYLDTFESLYTNSNLNNKERDSWVKLLFNTNVEFKNLLQDMDQFGNKIDTLVNKLIPVNIQEIYPKLVHEVFC